MDSYAKMWFGTEDKMQWIDCPLQGADVSPLGWSAEGTFLNGGGYAKHSWASHRNYVFEWRQSSARRMAQIMHNYRDGVYGRGLIHFVDPLTYDFNILPKQWAYPALMAGEANNPFLRGTALGTVATPTNTFNLPIQGAVVPLGSLTGFRATDSVFVPRPEGKVLQLWGLYTITGNATAGVYAIPVLDNGTNGTPVRLTPTALNGGTPAEYNLTTGKGVRLCVMKTSAASGTVNLFGLVARLGNADGFRAYSWAGTPDNSASIMRDADGVEVARNHAPNPSFEAAGSTVEVWRNLSVASRGVQSWKTSISAAYLHEPNIPVPVPHPLGIETCNRSSVREGAVTRRYLNTYDSDGLGITGPDRGLGFWALSMVPGLHARVNYNDLPDETWVPLEPGVWTWVALPGIAPAGTRFGSIIQATDDSLAVPGVAVYATGSLAIENVDVSQFAPGYFDHLYSPDPDLTPSAVGTPGASASVLRGVRMASMASGNSAEMIRSTSGASDRDHAGRLIKLGETQPYGVTTAPTAGNQWVHIRAVLYQEDAGAWANNLSSPFRRMYVNASGGSAVLQGPTNPGPGFHTRSLTISPSVTLTSSPVLHHGSLSPIGSSIWIDSLVVLVADTEAELNAQIAALDAVGGYFDGSMPSIAPGSAPLTEWLGGQGNSGCRFVGSPTYIENTGVNGGQISYAASFKEVGDWL